MLPISNRRNVPPPESARVHVRPAVAVQPWEDEVASVSSLSIGSTIGAMVPHTPLGFMFVALRVCLGGFMGFLSRPTTPYTPTPESGARLQTPATTRLQLRVFRGGSGLKQFTL